MTASYTQVMQSTSNFHDQVRETFFGVTECILDNSTSLNTGNHMLDLNPETRNDTIQKNIFSRQLFASRLFFGCAMTTPGG